MFEIDFHIEAFFHILSGDTLGMQEIKDKIDAIANDPSLYKASNFGPRLEAIDFIDFHGQIPLLKERAWKLKYELEQVDAVLFKTLQEKIRTGDSRGGAFRRLIADYLDPQDSEYGKPGYDQLDAFVNGLFSVYAMPEETVKLEPDMVYYQKTPARLVIELADKVQFSEKDVFFDLGAGLGQVAILINLLTGIKVRGVEIEPAFCAYADKCISHLNLSDITLINADARKVDYSEGTVFFMYTPFRGELLQSVLEILRKESLTRKISIITYGPCTVEVALQSWLVCGSANSVSTYELGVFTSA